MSLSTHTNTSSPYKSIANVLTLVLNEQNSVGISDRPIFGTTLTVRDDIQSLIGHVLKAGTIIGWLNFVDVSKLACITDDRHFLESSNFFYAKANQFVLLKPIVLHTVHNDMHKTKQIFTFSHIESNVHSIHSH